jgi:oligopeptide transport system substrate-binding protein
MSHKRFNTILAVAVTLSLLFLVPVSGCKTTPDEVTAPGKDEVLNLYGIDPHTLDPAISADSNSHQYVMQIFSGLLCLDDNMEPAPDIANDWKVSNGGKTYTFYLRRDVTFHDGRTVTAADFKYSWERACDPDTGSSTAADYLSDIVGAKEMLAGEASEISGIKVRDDYTLEVTIDAPKSYFLYKLAYPTSFVVDRDNVESGDEWWRKPNGTGPFTLGKWEKSNQLVLKRYGRYYGERAKVSSVIFSLWGGVPLVLYETGQIDITGVPVIYKDKVTDESGSFYRELEIFPEFSFYYLGFDTTRPPFDDVNIRLAFTMAVDKEKLASLVYRGMVEPAYGILPPGLPGYGEGLKGFPFNPTRARELISESGYGDISNLPPITLTTAGYGGIVSQELEAIVDQWRQNLGVEVAVRQLEPERYIYNLTKEKDETFDIGWIADYPHPQSFLALLFQSDAKHNYGEYSNPEVDTLLDTAGLEQDTETSFALYRQAEQLLVDDAACLPLWFGKNYVLVKPYVTGYYLNPLGAAMLNKVSVDIEEK